MRPVPTWFVRNLHKYRICLRIRTRIKEPGLGTSTALSIDYVNNMGKIFVFSNMVRITKVVAQFERLTL